MRKNYSDLSNFAAKVLAKAVLDSFPSSRLIRAETNDVGFFADLFFPDPLHDQILSFFEEKMRKILSDEKEIKIFEMMPENAIEYVVSMKRHDDRAYEHVNVYGSFQKMIKIGRFVDFIDVKEDKKWLEILKFFNLYNLKKKKNFLRIEGVACFDKKKIKDKLKKIRSYKKACHENIGVKMKYFLFDNNGNIILLPKALQVKNILERFYFKNLKDKFLFLQTPYAEDEDKKIACHIEMAKKYFKNRWPLRLAEKYSVFDGRETKHKSLFSYNIKEYFLETVFVDIDLLENECISNLQFIEKILKICGFSFYVVIQYPERAEKIDSIMLSALQKSNIKYEVKTKKEKEHLVIFALEDIKGREQKVMHLSAKSTLLSNYEKDYNEKPKAMIVRSSLPEMHKLLALLLEMKGEKFSIFISEMENLLNTWDNKF